MSVHIAQPEHEVAYQELCVLVSRHAKDMSAMEILAIAANMLGKLIALQKRSMSPEDAVELVMRNMERGNQEAMEQIAAGDLGGRRH